MSTKGNIETIFGRALEAQECDDLPEEQWEVAEAHEALIPSAREEQKLVSPDNIFESEYSEDLVDAARKRAQVFKDKRGRFDPFEKRYLKSLVLTASYSGLLKRSIISVKDAISHSLQMCIFWADEDGAFDTPLSAQELPQGTQLELIPEEKPQPKYSGNRDEKIEQARIAWKEAVSNRDRIYAEWNEYVIACRNRYKFERDLH